LPENLYLFLKYNPYMKLQILKSIDSTNSYLLEKIRKQELHSGDAVLADQQLNGRGRNGKVWQSDLNSGLYLSLGYKFNNIENLSCLSLVIGVSTVIALSRLFPKLNLKLKWPNDIYINNRKCAGILCESIISPDLKSAWVVIGLGLNLRIFDKNKGLLNACSLSEYVDISLTTSELANIIIEQWSKDLSEYEKFGFELFKNQWSKYDMLFGKSICVTSSKASIQAKAVGIDGLGQLLIETPGGLQAISVGEVSIIQK
jgi:BirA family biotin operon repressor/biotin-[acetyl-CoA-carboxylase] ligase